MKNTTTAALIFLLLPVSLVEAQYNVANYFDGHEIYNIEQYDGQLYFGMRENEESPTSVVRFDPVTKTYFTYPDFDFDENSETGKFGRVNISLDQNGAIWCGGYRVGFFDGESWVDKTPEDHTNNHWCSWVEVSGENDIYDAARDKFSQMRAINHLTENFHYFEAIFINSPRSWEHSFPFTRLS